jgi:hypothetical protein
MRRITRRRFRLRLAAAVAIAILAGSLLMPTGIAAGAEADDTLPGVPLPASPIGGTFSAADPADVFSTIVVHAGDVVEADLTVPEGGFFGLGLLPPGASSLEDSRAVWRTEAGSKSIRTIATASGTYYIAVMGYGESGAYTLAWHVSEMETMDPRIESNPATVTVTMYPDQATLPPVALSVGPVDYPIGWNWADPMSGPLSVTSDRSWASLDYGERDFMAWDATLHISRPSNAAGTYVAHLTAPSGDPAVRDGTIAVVVKVVTKVRASVHMHATIPSGFNEGHSIRVTGSLHTSSGKDIAGTVSIQQLVGDAESGDPAWTTIKTATLSRGNYGASVAVVSGSRVRVVYNGTATYRWAASASKLVRLRCVLSTPHIHPHLSPTSYAPVSGTCSPTHFDSYAMDGGGTTEYPPEVIRLEVQLYHDGKWRTSLDTVVAEGDGTWSTTYRPGTVAHRQRIRAVDVCGEHDRVYSAWAYFESLY